MDGPGRTGYNRAMKSRGFTLIELIVVISVIAVLMAVLLPALHGAREQARSALCQHRVRQLQLEFKQYTDSENGLFPHSLQFGRWPGPPNDYAGTPARDTIGWWWFDLLELVNRTSLRDSGTLECPSKRLDGVILTRDLLWGNYGVNQSLCIQTQMMFVGVPPADRGPSVNDVRHPGTTLLIVDGGYTIVSWLLAADEPPKAFRMLGIGTPYIPGLAINKERELEDGVIEDAIRGRHPGKTVNIGFVDGHVERRKADYLLVKKSGEDTYSGRSPLWDP